MARLRVPLDISLFSDKTKSLEIIVKEDITSEKVIRGILKKCSVSVDPNQFELCIISGTKCQPVKPDESLYHLFTSTESEGWKLKLQYSSKDSISSITRQTYLSNPSNASIQCVRQLKRKTKSYLRQLPLLPSTSHSAALQNSQPETNAPEQATVKGNLQEMLMSFEGDNKLFLCKIKEQAVILQQLIEEWESKARVAKTMVRQLSSAKEAQVLLKALTRRKSEISKLRIQLALFESNLLTAERMEKKRMEPHAFMLNTVDLELQAQRVYALELEDQLDHKTLDFNNAQKEIQEMSTCILSKQEELWRLRESLDSLEKCGLESSFSLQSSPSDKEMTSLQSLLASERQKNALLQQKLAQQVRPVFPSLYEQIHKKRVFTVVLQRDAESDPLGFQVRIITRSLFSGVSNIVVQQVMKSSLPLEVGDTILEVNGLLSWSTDNAKALQVLNETTDPLRLVLVRDEFLLSPTPPIASHDNLVRLQKSLEAVTIEKENKNKEIQELHLLAAELQDKVDKSKEVEDKLKTKLDNMKAHLSRLLSTKEITSESLKKSDARNSELKVELTQLTSQLDISSKRLQEKELPEDALKQSEMESTQLYKEKAEKQLAIKNSQKKTFQEKVSEANYTATIEKERHMDELSKLSQQFNVNSDKLTEEVDSLNPELSREKEIPQASNNDTMMQLKETQTKLEDQVQQNSQLMTKLQNYEEQIQVLKQNLDTQAEQLQETLAKAERDSMAHKLEIQSYKEQVPEMKEQSTILCSECDKLKADNDDLNSQLSSKKKTNRELLSRLGDLEDELKQTIVLNKNCNGQIEMLKVKADSEKTKLSNLQKKLSDSESEITTSKLEINAQKEQLQAITQQNVNLSSEISELKTQIESLNAELTQVKEVNDQLLETSGDVPRMLDEAETKLQTEQQQTSQLKKEVEDYMEEVQMLSQSTNLEKENQVVIVKRAQERQKILEKEKTELADEIEKFQTQVDSFEAQLKKERDEKDMLLLQLEEQKKENEKSLLETKQELKEAVDKYKAQVDTLNAQLAEQKKDLSTASSTIQRYEEHLSIADQGNANLCRDTGSLKEEVDRLKEKEVSVLHEQEEEKEMKEALMLKSKQELDQINHFETQIVSLNAQLKEKENTANMKTQVYEEQISKLDQETTELRVKINSFKMQIETLNAQLKEKENELSVANLKVKSNEEVMLNLNQEIMTFCAEINDLKTQIDNLQAELRKKEKEISATNEKILHYEEQLSQVNKTKHGLNSELDDLKMKVDDFNAQLMTERQVKDTKLCELEEEQKINESALLKMKVSNAELSGELNELKAEIESLRVQMSERENDIIATTSKIQDYEERLLKLDKEKAKLSKEADDLKIQVDCLHTQLTTEKEEKEATLLKLEEEKMMNGEKMKQSNTEDRREVNNLKSQIEFLNAQLSEKEKESLLTALKIQDYERQLKQVDQEKFELNSQIVQIKAQVNSLNDELMKEREEKDTILQKLEDEQKTKEDLLSETKAKIYSDLEQLQHDLDTCKNELALTKRTLSNAEKKMQAQNQQNRDLSNELEKFKAQIDDLNSELARVRQEKDTELQELKKINDATREAEIKLKDELESVSQANKDYKKQIEMITSDVTTEREELQQKLSEIDKEAKLKTQMYEKQLLDIKQQNTNLHDEIEIVKSKLDSLNDEHIKEKEETEAKFKELNEDKAVVLEKLADAESQLEENEKEERKLKTKIDDLEEELQTQHNKSEADLQQLKDKHHAEILEFEAKLKTLERNNLYQQKLSNASATDMGSKLASYEGENNRLHKYVEKLLAVVMEKHPSLLEEVSRLE